MSLFFQTLCFSFLNTLRVIPSYFNSTSSYSNSMTTSATLTSNGNSTQTGIFIFRRSLNRTCMSFGFFFNVQHTHHNHLLEIRRKSKQGLETGRLVLMLVVLASKFVNLDSKITYCIVAPLNLPWPPKIRFCTRGPPECPVAPRRATWPPVGNRCTRSFVIYQPLKNSVEF